MSYYTNVEFTFSDDPPDFEAVLSRARSYLEAREREYAVDFILEQLRHALEEEKGDFKGLWSDDIDGLMEHISAGFPGRAFYVRGMGEEFADVWIRLYRDGKIVFRVGPFEEELDSSLAEEATDDG
ncbi:MAG TPA: hypothetical protein VG406_00800 [Isosphaeraceae bacterium]|jgi:hypothetical protein|nr:hypothetical protein [Isosphaeraceae bacterium]